MYVRLLLTLTLLLLAVPSALGQGSERISVAILRYGSLDFAGMQEYAILDILQVYGWISADERALLSGRQDFQGEKVSIIWGDANYDLPTVNLMIDEALDKGADILVTLSTPVTQIAVNTTLDQDVPTPVLFSAVFDAFRAGIADAHCIKPDHVTGSQNAPPYHEALRLFLLQNPEMKRVGTIYSLTDASGAAGAEDIQQLGQALGLTVESAAVAGVSDLRAATQGLVNKGVEALILPFDSTIAIGLPIIVTVATENMIPTFKAASGSIFQGATIGAGFYQYYVQGINVGLMLAAWLNGELDIARTAIDSNSSYMVSVNHDIAGELGMEINEDVVEMADVVVQDDMVSVSPRVALEQLEAMGADDATKQMALSFTSEQSVEVMVDLMRNGRQLPAQLADFLIRGRRADPFMATDAAFLQSLHCSDEKVAEQQAALDAAEE